MKYSYIPWPTSDGSHYPQRPSNFQYNANPDDNGFVDYSAALSPSDPHYERWCVHVGKWAAKTLGLPRGKTYCLDGFPEGYTLYCHYKTETKDDERTDYYLYGSKGVARFRSPNEFAPHALWLLTRAEPGTCKCIYCRKGYTQTEVDKELGLPRERSRVVKRSDDDFV
ncbi:hypothetical protein BDV93DRAFT_521532 [Ceratobasidium sp. AG-I]|nr:hypothetical protein BDV93DRAFT_521532 [Ceratobasidium sp. AG-I]